MLPLLYGPLFKPSARKVDCRRWGRLVVGIHLDVDGSIVATTGACNEGMDLSYKGVWGYHPLFVSMANAQEPLFVVNRPANRPSHDEAVYWIDQSSPWCDRWPSAAWSSAATPTSPKRVNSTA